MWETGWENDSQPATLIVYYVGRMVFYLSVMFYMSDIIFFMARRRRKIG